MGTGPAQPDILLRIALLDRACTDLLDLLKASEVRADRLRYAAIKRAWLLITDLYPLARENEAPEWTDALQPSEVGLT